MFKFLLTYLLACPCCPPFSLEAMFAESENLFIGKIKTVQLFYPNYLIHTKKEADENTAEYILGLPMVSDTNLLLQYENDAKKMGYAWYTSVPQEYILTFDVIWSFKGNMKTQKLSRFIHSDGSTISIKSLLAAQLNFSELYLINIPNSWVTMDKQKNFTLNYCNWSGTPNAETLKKIVNFYCKHKPLKKKKFQKIMSKNQGFAKNKY